MLYRISISILRRRGDGGRGRELQAARPHRHHQRRPGVHRALHVQVRKHTNSSGLCNTVTTVSTTAWLSSLPQSELHLSLLDPLFSPVQVLL